jgi:hypothetical protein
MGLLMTVRKLAQVALAVFSIFLAGQFFAADIKGQVMGGSPPVAQSTVTLIQASGGEPKQLAQTKTDSNGNVVIRGMFVWKDAFEVAAGLMAKRVRGLILHRGISRSETLIRLFLAPP